MIPQLNLQSFSQNSKPKWFTVGWARAQPTQPNQLAAPAPVGATWARASRPMKIRWLRSRLLPRARASVAAASAPWRAQGMGQRPVTSVSSQRLQALIAQRAAAPEVSFPCSSPAPIALMEPLAAGLTVGQP